MSDENIYRRRTVQKETVYSHALGKERPLRIFLPPGYNELVSHRVMYCQDGEEAFNFGRIATHASRLILDEGLEPFIIVGVDVDMPNRTAEYAPDGERFEAYCRFFVEELIPFVEERYPIRRGAGDRILVGDSLGGTVSLHLSLQAPHLFQKVIALSGAFLEPSVESVRSGAVLSWLRLYQVIGTEETEVSTTRGVFDFLTWNRTMHRALLSKSAAVAYVEKQGKHQWGFWQNELPEAIRWAFAE
ncbi:alpha/beta hydrolase [Paenibacillus thermotolerans]|uniref:alpha/beta hydrolase n=1 Tax=Paenibacillus thermotolerans TaxID=3027807 RepID=UPI00236821B7|nr:MULTISPECIES: alpha/beta hydrolase-fold protein [unclassified Paenibacillus]